MFLRSRRSTDAATASDPRDPIMYVLMSFPRLSETFVLNEILHLEAAGEVVLIDVLRAPPDEPRHPELERLRAERRYVTRPRTSRRADAAHLARALRAHLAIALHHPVRWVRTAVRAARERRPGHFLTAGLTAHRAIQKRARHIHTHFAHSADVAADAAALSGLPFTVHAHAYDIYHREHVPHLRRRLERAAAVLTESRYNVRHLQGIVPNVPIHHLPTAVPAGPPSRCAPNGPILSVARLVPKKGVDVLIEACARLSPKLPQLTVEVIGTGPCEEELIRLADARGLRGQTVFHGAMPSDAITAAFQRCSMFVLPCRVDADGDRDGMPTVLIEAMAHGIPVISTDIIGIPELVVPRETGLLVPADDPDALAEAILELTRKPELARRLGLAGRRLVLEQHSPERTTQRLRGVLSPG